jgi:anti-sigma B factor antagonist
MRRGLKIDVLRHGVELTLSGRLDARSAPSVRASLHEAIDDGSGDLTVNLGALEIWDATGLGVLAGASRRARRLGRRLVLTEVRPRELRLLRVARVPRTAAIHPAVLAQF